MVAVSAWRGSALNFRPLEWPGAGEEVRKRKMRFPLNSGETSAVNSRQGRGGDAGVLPKRLRVYKGCTRDVQGMHKGCTRDAQGMHKGAIPGYHRGITGARRGQPAQDRRAAAGIPTGVKQELNELNWLHKLHWCNELQEATGGGWRREGGVAGAGKGMEMTGVQRVRQWRSRREQAFFRSGRGGKYEEKAKAPCVDGPGENTPTI